ncbi:MAG TPA: c-type cytochrome [Bryobacteraceae bacterium]|nr:c-type cytochrome [Bryobacteraceae bacterium]
MLRRFPVLILAAPLLLVPHAFGQQTGAALFRASCANCHGERGDMIAGVDLGHGKFRHASTDDDLVKIILNGIPGTGMPPNTMTNAQAASIVAYLRSIAPPAGAAGGDIASGKALFASRGCVNCHRILGTGSRVGPDLSEIGSFRKPAELEQSVTDPDAVIEPDNRTFHATTKDGTQITGRVIDEDGFGMRVIDSREHLLALNKADLREFSFSPKSGMPSFKERLSAQELSDLVAYLSSLKRMDAK